MLFLALSSLIGDTVILVASRNRENFRLNKFLVAIMQHIAVCDISVSIIMILPTAVSLLADAWVLGDVLCCVQPYISYYFYSVNLSLICVLTTSKFLLLRKPAQARKWSKKRAHIICGMIWMLFLLNPILLYTLGKDDSSFDYRLYLCAYGFNSYTWKKILPLVSVINFIIPNSVMIATTIPTLKYLFEARKSAIRNKKSVPCPMARSLDSLLDRNCLSSYNIAYWCILLGTFFCKYRNLRISPLLQIRNLSNDGKCFI